MDGIYFSLLIRNFNVINSKFNFSMIMVQGMEELNVKIFNLLFRNINNGLFEGIVSTFEMSNSVFGDVNSTFLIQNSLIVSSNLNYFHLSSSIFIGYETISSGSVSYNNIIVISFFYSGYKFLLLSKSFCPNNY